MKELHIDNESSPQRFDRFCRKYFKKYTDVKLADIYRWIRKGDIRVNGKKAKEEYVLQNGDVVMLKNFVLKQLGAETKQERIDALDVREIEQLIIYEDQDWLVFNKPAGVPMHGGTKNTDTVCMNNYLDKYIQATQNSREYSKEDPRTFKANFCYRLDKDTSGVLIAAKKYQSLQYLNTLIRERKTEKEYITIVSGDAKHDERITVPLEKGYNKKFGRGVTEVNKNGKPAETQYKKIETITHESLGKISLLQVEIFTGRMHQIRVHLAHVGLPVLGDMIYGKPAVNRKLYKDLKINRQILHCKQYSFVDAKGRKYSFSAPIPDDIKKIMK